jgi:phosphate transport system substrate-binding protein
MVKAALLAIVIAEIVLVVLGAYGAYVATQPVSASDQVVTLTGAGATLAYPLLASAASLYGQSHPNIRINYQPIGSTAGVNQFLYKTIDFGATYPPMTQAERNAAPGIPIHLPESISPVVVAYNVPGVQSGIHLQLNGTVIADIFLGRVQYWNDSEITSLNPGLSLQPNKIQTWHMAEGEGTTFVFTSYLSIVSKSFKQQVGKGTLVTWPVGVSVPTDEGVATGMTTTPNSIGYMELSYAIKAQLNYASILNKDGNNYVFPSSTTAQVAEQQLPTALPDGEGDWSSIALLNEPGRNAYPMVTFTYVIVYRDLSILPSMDLTKAKGLVSFLWYLVHDAQSLGPPLGYVPLPSNVVHIDEVSLQSMTFQGHALT